MKEDEEVETMLGDVTHIPGWSELSDHDKEEVRKFAALLKRRAEKPDEPAFHAYAETHGEVVYEHPPMPAEDETCTCCNAPPFTPCHPWCTAN